MNTLGPDTLHRTLKLELDEGHARTVNDADRIVAGYVLQIDAGEGLIESATRQAMLLTAVNAGSRAFLGGVRVRIRQNGPARLRWAAGQCITKTVEEFGGTIVDSFDSEYPTLVIGEVAEKPPGRIVLYATWEGWSGGIVQDDADRLPELSEFPIAGMLSAALGISEAFQNMRGHAVAGRRSVGVSLWNPNWDWHSQPAFGESCVYLPSRLWLVGLGHLGQAYAWALGLLPYDDTSRVLLMLQDYDDVEAANKSTGMLSTERSVDSLKTRVVSERMGALGFETRMSERRFDDSTIRRPDEPGVALVGVDKVAPRRLLGRAGFDLAIDAGLGGKPQNYLDMLIHSFPSEVDAQTAWSEETPSQESVPLEMPAYQDQRQLLNETTDQTDEEIKCGMLEVAGQSVGAAFVGCVAATLVISEVLRALANGPRFQVLNLHLRNPDVLKAVDNVRTGPPTNPGFVYACPNP